MHVPVAPLTLRHFRFPRSALRGGLNWGRFLSALAPSGRMEFGRSALLTVNLCGGTFGARGRRVRGAGNSTRPNCGQVALVKPLGRRPAGAFPRTTASRILKAAPLGADPPVYCCRRCCQTSGHQRASEREPTKLTTDERLSPVAQPVVCQAKRYWWPASYMLFVSARARASERDGR